MKKFIAVFIVFACLCSNSYAAELGFSAMPFTNENASFLEQAGDIGSIAVPISAAITSIANSDEDGSRQLLGTYAATMATTALLKSTVNEARPEPYENQQDSFPSGHAASAFAGAAFLDKRYGLAYGIPAYLVAGFVGYSRVETNHHHLIDVAAGAALGYGFNHFITKKYDGKNNRQNNTAIPVLLTSETGIDNSMSFGFNYSGNSEYMFTPEILDEGAKLSFGLRF
jgi:PAP2 superfamily